MSESRLFAASGFLLPSFYPLYDVDQYDLEVESSTSVPHVVWQSPELYENNALIQRETKTSNNGDNRTNKDIETNQNDTTPETLVDEAIIRVGKARKANPADSLGK